MAVSREHDHQSEEKGEAEQEAEQNLSGLSPIQRRLLERKRRQHARSHEQKSVAAEQAKPAATSTQGAFDPVAQLDALHEALARVEGHLPAWQAGVDALDPNALRAAGAMAVADWTLAVVLQATLEGTQESVVAKGALFLAGVRLARFGLGTFRGRQLLQVAAHVKGDPTSWLTGQIDRCARTLEDANQMVSAFGAAKKKGETGMALAVDHPTQLRLYRLLQAHTQLGEMAFMQEVLARNGINEESLGGYFSGAALELGELKKQKKAEQTATRGGQDQVSPEMMARLQADRDRLISLVLETQDSESPMEDHFKQFGTKFVSILSSYSPEDRQRLLNLLPALVGPNQDVVPLQEMVHHGGPEVERLIQETPVYAGFTVNQAVLTQTRHERIHHAMMTGLRAAPAAPVAFVGGVFHGLGNVPLVGGVFERAGDGYSKLALSIDSKMGLDERLARASVVTADFFGAIDAEIAKVVVGGEVEEVEAAKEAYDAASTAKQVADLIAGVRDAMENIDEVWSIGSEMLTELGPIVGRLCAGDAFSSPEKSVALLNDVDDLLKTLLESWNVKAAALFTEKGKAEWDEKQEADKFNKDERQRSQAAALPPGWREQAKALADAGTELIAAKDDAARQAAQQKVIAARNALQALTPGVGNSMLARAKELEGAKAKKDAAARQQKAAAAAQRVTSKAKLKYAAHGVWEALKGAAIRAIAGVAQELRKELIEKALSWAGDPAKEPKEKKRLIFKLVVAAVNGAIGGGAVDLAEAELKKSVEWAIRKLVEQRFAGLEGVVQLADGPIQKLLGYLADQLKAEQHLEKLFESLVAQFGSPEDGPETEGAKKGGEPAPAAD